MLETKRLLYGIQLTEEEWDYIHFTVVPYLEGEGIIPVTDDKILHYLIQSARRIK